MPILDPKTPLRVELARVFKDQRTLKAFEKLFELVPKALDNNQELIEEALNSAANAESNAAALLAIVFVLQHLAEESALRNECVCFAPDQDIPNNSLEVPRDEDISNSLISISLEEDVPNVDFLPRKLSLDSIDFDISNLFQSKVGSLSWGVNDDTLCIGHSGGVVQQVGEELFARVTNSTGSTITNGQFVGLTGSGTTVIPYIANASVPPLYAIGVATQDILNGQRGRLTVWGRVRGLNTSGWSVGAVLYASPTIAGALTNIKPTAPNLVIPVGVVTAVHATDGEVFVRPLIEQQLYYGSFSKTNDQSISAANTAASIPLTNTEISNGVVLGTTTSQIIVQHSGLYNFDCSFKIDSTGLAQKTVYLWFRKNGVDVPNSSIAVSLDALGDIISASRSLFFSLQANDYIELMWASTSTSVTLDSIAATGFCPASPCVTVTVTQIQQ